MPDLDSTAKAAVEGNVAPAWFIWCDINGDPLRVTNYQSDVTFSGTGDSDLDGHTFIAKGGSLLDVSDVSNSEGGSETVTVTLSGIVSMDTTLVNDIGDKSLWQGRECRIWFQLYDETGTVKQGAIVPHYTGYMSKVSFSAAPDGQTIQLSVENYLSFFSQASNRSYLKQSDYDAADTSAQATIACSNGIRRDTGAGGLLGGGASQGGSDPYGYGTGGTGGGYGTYSPYPDNAGQSFEPNYLQTSRA